MVCFRKLENPFCEAMKICVFLNLLSVIDIKTGIDMSLSSSLNSAPWIATGIIKISIVNNRAVNGGKEDRGDNFPQNQPDFWSPLQP